MTDHDAMTDHDTYCLICFHEVILKKTPKKCQDVSCRKNVSGQLETQ